MIRGSRKVNGKSVFEQKWGISADELAKSEGVSPSAIHMRVRNYGTPWQRKKRPTQIESIYGKTLWELAIELDLHPASVQRRFNERGDVYGVRIYTKPYSDDWKTELFYREKFWLMPEHPDYEKARQGDWYGQTK